MKRERKGGWFVQCKRGRWFAVDRQTGRRVKAHDRGHAERIASEKNLIDLCGGARTPAALVWG